MGTEWLFKLPTPPTTNNLFVNVQGVGRVLSKGYKVWRENAVKLLCTQRRPAEPITHFVSLDIRVPKQRGDLSNRLKAPEDALVKAGILKDDSLVQHITAEWFDGPDCLVTLSTFEQRARDTGAV